MTTILMSTYNGARYLHQQIDSIVAQTDHDWRLILRDDGSTDATPAILGYYAKAHPERISVMSDNRRNVGAMRSFERLLEQVPAEADYVMFADQDDVWLPEKVAVTKAKMQELEAVHGKQKPIVVHTDLKVVNQDLKEMHPSFWRFSNIRPEILDRDVHYLGICNAVTGCAMMMNRAALTISLPFADYAFMHDWWIAEKVMTEGGIVCPLAQPTILYRQHLSNVVGAVSYRFTLLDWANKWKLSKRSYDAGHPLVWKNAFQFILWKTKYFFLLHTAK